MNDRPSAAELSDAVRHFLEAELLPALSDARLRFQTLIAANVLGIVARELPAEEAHLAEEQALLGRILHQEQSRPATLAELRQAVLRGNWELCERIKAGAFDEGEAFRQLAEQLRAVVVRKLEIANPRYLATRG
jgi:hypothetical protein